MSATKGGEAQTNSPVRTNCPLRPTSGRAEPSELVTEAESCQSGVARMKTREAEGNISKERMQAEQQGGRRFQAQYQHQHPVPSMQQNTQKMNSNLLNGCRSSLKDNNLDGYWKDALFLYLDIIQVFRIVFGEVGNTFDD